MPEEENARINLLRFRDFTSKWIVLRILYEWLLEFSRIGLSIAIPLQISALTNLFVADDQWSSGPVTIAAIKVLVLAISLQCVILFLKLHELKLFTDLLQRTTIFLFENVFSRSPEFFCKYETQTINVRLLEETPNVADHWRDSYIKLPIAFLSITAFGLIMFQENPFLATLMVPLSVAGGFTYLFNQRLRERSRSLRTGWEVLRATADETIGNFEELRANEATGYGLRIIRHDYEEHCDRYYAMKRSEMWTQSIPKLVSAAQLGILFLVGVQLCSEGTWLHSVSGGCDWGTVVGFLFFLKLFHKPVESVVDYSIKRQRRLESINAINELLSQENEESIQHSRISTKSCPTIHAKNLVVKGNAGAKILDEVSLTVSPGQKVAITGPSGSGKSTLVRTLAGIVRPSSGSVQFIHSDLDEPLEHCPRGLAYLPQRPVLFSWSIRDNLLLGLRKPLHSEIDEELNNIDLHQYPEITSTRAFDKLLLRIVENVGLKYDLFARGLDRPLSARFFQATEIGIQEVKEKVSERLKALNIEFEESNQNSLRCELLGGRPRFGNSELTRQIEDVIYSVCHDFGFAHNVVLSGMTTPISGSKSGLSGGQEQKIALAKALIRKPEVLLLDEAVSNLDGTSKESVLGHLRSLASTVVFVSHDPVEIATADRVVVIEKGRIVQGVSSRT